MNAHATIPLHGKRLGSCLNFGIYTKFKMKFLRYYSKICFNKYFVAIPHRRYSTVNYFC